MVPGEMFGRRVANAVRTPRSMYRDDGRWGERLRKRVRRFFAASAARTALRMTHKNALFAIVIPAQAGIQMTRSGLRTNARGVARGLSCVGPSGLDRCVKGRSETQRGEIPQPGSQGRAASWLKRIAG